MNGTNCSLFPWSSTEPVSHDGGATIASTRDPSEATADVSSPGRLTSAAAGFMAITTAASRRAVPRIAAALPRRRGCLQLL